MNNETVTLFFGLLASLAQVVVVAAALLLAGSFVSPTVARLKRPICEHLAPQALVLAAAVALTCTVGSLHLSEVAHFPPCRLCWFQRIAMYPLVVVLGVAAIRRDYGARLTGGIIAGVGAAISTWHLLVERYPNLGSSSCDVVNPCSIKWVEEFGYLTVPGMALSGFALIGVLLVIAGPSADSQT